MSGRKASRGTVITPPFFFLLGTSALAVYYATDEEPGTSGRKTSIAIAAALLTALAFAAPVLAVPSTVELTVQTDKAVYRPGEEVQIHYRVYNNSDYTVSFYGGCNIGAFENAARNDWIYLVSHQEAVWWANTIHPADLNPWLWLGPGETWERDGTWDLREREHGLFVNPGEYEIIGSISSPSTPPPGAQIGLTNLTAHIYVVPEPSTFPLVSGLAVLALGRKRNRRKRAV